MKVLEYKQFKELKKENLRDNMANLELVLNMLAEASTTEISKNKLPETFGENKVVAKQGGEVAKKAREELEKKTGEKVISKNKESLVAMIDNKSKVIKEDANNFSELIKRKANSKFHA